MRARSLGRTGYDVSEIGFGAWGLGGSMWLGVEDSESLKAVHEALDLGINFFDTALAYGDGHSERLLGKSLGGSTERDRIVVATKVPPMDHVWPGQGSTPLARVFPVDHVVGSVERSLRNLRTEALQVEQFHVWHDSWLDSPEWDAVRKAMERLKKEGKVLHWGVSINDHAPETALRLLGDPIIETVQAIYNIYDRSPERDLFALVRSRNLGLIIRVPFDEGSLTGTIGPETDFPKGDWRHRYFREDRKAEAGRRASAIAPLLGKEAATLPELALRFCLSPAEVSSVIPGMRRREHARTNAAVSDGRALSAGLLESLKAHAWEKNWYK